MEIWFRAADKDAIAGAREEEGLAQITALALQLLGLAGGAWLVTRTLRPIRNFSSAAQKIATGDLGQRTNTPDSESELGQLAGVLNSTFARLDAGQEPLRRDECHLSQLTADSIELIRPLAATRGIHIQTDLPAILCHGDADRLAQVITNLLTNAIDYNDDDGGVHVTTRRDNGTVTLTVRNTGPGIPAEDLPHICRLCGRVHFAAFGQARERLEDDDQRAAAAPARARPRRAPVRHRTGQRSWACSHR